MKKIIRLTEKDLTRIIKRVIKEGEDEDYPPYYDIESFDCGDNVRSGHVHIDEDTIVIRYCKGNKEDFKYLKKKGRKLYDSIHLSNPLLYPDYKEDYDEDDDYLY